MQIAKFVVFIVYITAVFFLPNDWWVMAALAINLSWGLIIGCRDLPMLGKIWRGTMRVLPFVLLTVIFNWWLDSWQAAVWMGLKLLIVCNATMIYSARKTVTEVAGMLAGLCVPLQIVGVHQQDVRILVSVALMMIPVLSKELKEMQQACKAKGASWDLPTLKLVLQKIGWSLLGRANQIEEGLMAKGIELE